MREYWIFTLLLLLPGLCWGQLCQDTRNPLNGLGQMTTAKNTKIYSLYSQHMDPQDQQMVQKWITSKVPIGDFASLARLLLRKHTAILAQKRQELKVLRDLHLENKIHWIGIELSPEELQAFQPEIKEQAVALKSVLVQKGLSATEADDLALLIYDSGHYFVAHQAADSKPLQLIGLEEDASYAASLDQAEKLSQARQNLAAKTHSLKVPNSVVQDFDNEVSEILGENTKRSGPAKLKRSQARLVSRMPSSEGKALMKNSLETAHRFVEVSLQRDQKISEQVWKNSKSSGIFIYGRAHQSGITQSLISWCRRGI